MIYRLGELFCGPGGIGWGATNADIGDANYRIVHQWANDYDESTCETYRHNICPNAPETVYHGDIRTFDMSQLAPIDALAFGFPCNDYSVVGEQKGMNGTFGPLYSYGVKALKLFKPMWFLAENVGGLRSANEGKALNKILDELQGAGYTITPHLYKFEDCDLCFGTVAWVQGFFSINSHFTACSKQFLSSLLISLTVLEDTNSFRLVLFNGLITARLFKRL